MGDRIDELQGKTKEGVGNLTGNEGMAREGEAEADAAKLQRETEGAIDKGVGKVQEIVGDVLTTKTWRRKARPASWKATSSAPVRSPLPPPSPPGSSDTEPGGFSCP